MQHSKPGEPQILIDLSTAIIGTDGGTFQCRLVEDDTETETGRLPFGPLCPTSTARWKSACANGSANRWGSGWAMLSNYTHLPTGPPAPTPGAPHVVSVGYLALTNQTGGQTRAWRDIYNFFPWEDWRDGEPSMLADIIYPALDSWLARHADRRASARLAFGRHGLPWGEEYVLERYELLYEAGLVAEAFTDGRENAMPNQLFPAKPYSSIIGAFWRPLLVGCAQIEISAGNFRPDAADIYPDPVAAHAERCWVLPCTSRIFAGLRKIGLSGSHGKMSKHAVDRRNC